MTNAQLAAHFAALPPDETASIVVLDANGGTSRTVYPVEATDRMLSQIEPDELGLADTGFDSDDESEEAEEARRKARESWLGEVVIFEKY